MTYTVVSWIEPNTAPAVARLDPEAFEPRTRPCLRVWVDAVLDDLLASANPAAVGIHARALFGWLTPPPARALWKNDLVPVEFQVDGRLAWAGPITAIDPLLNTTGPKLLEERLLDMGFNKDRIEEELPFLVSPQAPMYQAGGAQYFLELEPNLRSAVSTAMAPELTAYSQGLAPLASIDQNGGELWEVLIPIESVRVVPVPWAGRQ